jgi:uncharacterized surface protein with fasciclin (FAS1) repeats
MKRNIKLMILGLIGLSLCIHFSCRKDKLVQSVSNVVNMTQYLNEHPDNFSELSKILKISGTASFLNAYGSYTLFAPTNEAVRSYLQEKGKANVEAVGEEEWKSFVRLHLLEDSIPTSKFTDGKLFKLTMYGQYLTTSTVNTDGITKLRVNRQANIVNANILVGNGLIHSIDQVLKPAERSVAQTIEANPQYTIFTAALKATGLYDSLNVMPTDNPDVNKKFLTVIAETDETFAQAGIPDFKTLSTRLSRSGNPMSKTDSLHIFMQYHILYDAKYLADIIVADAHRTLAPLEVLTSKLSGQTVLMNDDVFNGTREPGFELIRNLSDVTANNGVVHQASKHFAIKVRSPYRVDFDVAAFPELLKNTAYYKVKTYTFSPEESATLSEIKFSGPENGLIYTYGSAGTSKNSHNVDVLVVPLATGGAASRAEWVEFRTPLLIRGKYKVWVGYFSQAQSSNTTTEVQASIGMDGTADRLPLSNSRTLSFTTKRPGINKTVNGVTVIDADAEEAIGWKTYMVSTAGAQVARLMGIADIPQTGRYWIRFRAINGSQTTNNFDMIHLIPVAEDQQYWKYNPDGSKILRQ